MTKRLGAPHKEEGWTHQTAWGIIRPETVEKWLQEKTTT